jgi:hypothetical protein
MSTTDTIEVVIHLPPELYERVAREAASEAHGTEEFLGTLIAQGIDAHRSTREILEEVSRSYRTRLRRAGKTDQSADEVLAELGQVREQVARELYP